MVHEGFLWVMQFWKFSQSILEEIGGSNGFNFNTVKVYISCENLQCLYYEFNVSVTVLFLATYSQMDISYHYFKIS